MPPVIPQHRVRSKPEVPLSAPPQTHRKKEIGFKETWCSGGLGIESGLPHAEHVLQLFGSSPIQGKVEVDHKAGSCSLVAQVERPSG